MRHAVTLLAALLVMGTAALAAPHTRAPSTAARLAQNRAPARADAGAPVADAGAPSRDASASDASAPATSSPTCCCRAWSHGWQHAWRTERECTSQNGTCVSPDHC